jgi:hypothetical protein
MHVLCRENCHSAPFKNVLTLNGNRWKRERSHTISATLCSGFACTIKNVLMDAVRLFLISDEPVKLHRHKAQLYLVDILELLNWSFCATMLESEGKKIILENWKKKSWSKFNTKFYLYIRIRTFWKFQFLCLNIFCVYK